MLKFTRAALLALPLTIPSSASADCDTSAVEDSAPCGLSCLCNVTYLDGDPYECIVVPPGYDGAGQMEWWPNVCPTGYDVAACMVSGGAWWVEDATYAGVCYPACQ